MTYRICRSRPNSARTQGLLLLLLLLVAFPWSASAQVPYELSSAYVPMKDGTRIAVDVYLPTDRQPGERLPAIMELTRYWRGAEDPESGEAIVRWQGPEMAFLSQGYALLKIDVRGSGASFGSRSMEYGPKEVRDGYDIVEWVTQQDWSNGKVGAYGTSYSGTTAELLTAAGHPAVKAVIPGWSDFDAFRSPARPYGLIATGFIEKWSEIVGLLDSNDPRIGGLVRRVDGDSDGSLRAAAVNEHAANPNVFEMVSRLEFRDRKASGGYSFADASSMVWREEIEASGAAMLVLASWLDAGTAGGALHRFQHFSNPQQLLILASSHGGGAHASPYVVGKKLLPPLPTTLEQVQLRVRFFNHHLKGEDNGIDAEPAIRYFNLGEEAFRETDVWPPAGTTRERHYLAANGMLSTEPPPSGDGVDTYEVDFSVSTGKTNRWSTQMGGPVLELDDRGRMDKRMLTYTSEPLGEDLQITGTPTVSLTVTSNRDDGAFLVYLEDVDEAGRSRYITEGGLRAIHREMSANPYFDQTTPYHSYAEADSLPLVPGEPAELVFEMWPTSVLLKKGHRLRIAIAGADADMFDRVPAKGDVTMKVMRGSGSWIELPVVSSSD
jgi:putative CocE/NonD family hydrolase